MEPLDERSKQILYAIIQSYINKPDPVGSRFVTKKYAFGFSPATIRNIMADLEELGFLSQPHTSAGRVPTDKGYRFYVNSLLGQDRNPDTSGIESAFIDNFSRKLDDIKNDINGMFSEVSNTLSSMSSYVGVALPPKPEKTHFNRIDFMKYKGDHVVAVILTDEGVMKHKIIKTDPLLSQDDLNRIAEYLNSEYAGRTIDDIKSVLIGRMKADKVLWDKLISRAITLCEEILSFSESDIYFSGLHDVMNLPDFSDISKIKEISKAIKDKHTILRLLDQLSNNEGVQVMIGNENPVDEMKNLSIVTSTYKEGDSHMGLIALIGPTRMDYSKAIFMVETVAGCISRTLKG
ncbi:MAG: heat-inducible transcription repressor HrcA [Nitrospirae bacterium]|nr:MAG: heat-inducible transcription repressor HrcA [Nitrospirota bacterium]